MMVMKFNQHQIECLSKYFADTSKIIAASSVVGFFIPTANTPITLPTFTLGFLISLIFLILSIHLLKN